MKCEVCNHEQLSGKFCGKCGNTLLANPAASQVPEFQNATTEGPSTHSAATAAAYQAPVDPHVHVQKAKETSKAYWNYFLESLYNPSKVLNEKDQNFGNALITFAIFALITSLGMNKLANSLLTIFGDFGVGPSFIDVFLRVTLAVAVLFALSLGSLYVVSKLFGPQTPLKTLVTMMGTYLVPASVLVLATVGLLLIGSLGFGSSLFFFGLFFAIYVMPVILIGSLINQKSQKLDKFYAVSAYVVIFSIALSILFNIYAESTIIPMVETVFSLLNPYGDMPF